MELFSSGEPVKICAPMVRYSKLAFRNLVRLYDCDLAFSPMIMADSFHMSQGRSCFYNVISYYLLLLKSSYTGNGTHGQKIVYFQHK